eukprot:TRINITY_DN68010_c8_g1_i3.p1 TRINITY_DN68010_c8_g1~~TRINITY_DN68010_c8_g1_i3.p1  ORF type:complete len:124 (-),score=6.93 TRINITY_DN68010_c8_g1_i3:260-631(-)
MTLPTSSATDSFAGNGMYCVVYRFEVKQDVFKSFCDNWKYITEAYLQVGSLGSRLHKVLGKDDEYTAYAQWPNKEMFENARDGKTAMPNREEFDKVFATLAKQCSSFEVVFEMEPLCDLLKKP